MTQDSFHFIHSSTFAFHRGSSIYRGVKYSKRSRTTFLRKKSKKKKKNQKSKITKIIKTNYEKNH